MPEEPARCPGNTRPHVVAEQVQRRRLPLGFHRAAADPAAGHGVGAEEAEGEDADAARRLALIGDIGMGVGLVAAGIGTYLLFSEEDSTDSSKVRVGPWAAAGAGGLVAVGRF